MYKRQALYPVVSNIPKYVQGVKDVYMPVVNQIMATDGFQKIMEKIGEASPVLMSPKSYDLSLIHIYSRYKKSPLSFLNRLHEPCQKYYLPFFSPLSLTFAYYRLLKSAIYPDSGRILHFLL